MLIQEPDIQISRKGVVKNMVWKGGMGVKGWWRSHWESGDVGDKIMKNKVQNTNTYKCVRYVPYMSRIFKTSACTILCRPSGIQKSCILDPLIGQVMYITYYWCDHGDNTLHGEYLCVVRYIPYTMYDTGKVSKPSKRLLGNCYNGVITSDMRKPGSLSDSCQKRNHVFGDDLFTMQHQY